MLLKLELEARKPIFKLIFLINWIGLSRMIVCFVLLALAAQKIALQAVH